MFQEQTIQIPVLQDPYSRKEGYPKPVTIIAPDEQGYFSSQHIGVSAIAIGERTVTDVDVSTGEPIEDIIQVALVESHNRYIWIDSKCIGIFRNGERV